MEGVEKIMDIKSRNNILIVTPVYNDWESFKNLASDIDKIIGGSHDISILIVNDGSTIPHEMVGQYNNISTIDIINLIGNMGHQRAISVGLASVDTSFYDFVIVMDSDGEDKVSYIPEFIKLFNKTGGIVVAERTKRSESIIFRIFYYFYKTIFRILTGMSISFGNFSLIPANFISRIIALPESWNNYPSAILKSKLPISYLDTIRGERYSGESKMNFTSLLLHGFGSISVFSEFVLVRTLISFLVFFLCLILLLLFVLSLRFIFDLYIFPGWATAFSGFIAVMLFQVLIFLMITIFMYLGNRSNISFSLKSVFRQYIDSTENVYRK